MITRSTHHSQGPSNHYKVAHKNVKLGAATSTNFMKNNGIPQ